MEFEEEFAGVALDDFISRRSPRWESIANGGVQVFNVKKWIASNMTEKALAFIETYKPIELLTDEVVLNALLYNEWKRLDPGFNTGYAKCFFLFSLTKRSQLRIIHFIGPRKPWKFHITTPLAYPYLNVYKRRAKKLLSEKFLL